MQFCSKCGKTLEVEVLEAEPADETAVEEQHTFEQPKQDVWTMDFWFSPHGRRNRKPYIYYLMAVWLLGGSISATLTAFFAPLGTLFGALIFYMDCINCIKRLHDVEMSGWWVIIPTVALYGSIFGTFVGSAVISFPVAFIILVAKCFLWVYLLFKKGTEGPNQYGPAVI